VVLIKIKYSKNIELSIFFIYMNSIKLFACLNFLINNETINHKINNSTKIGNIYLHEDPLSTISAIWPNVTQGHQNVMQPVKPQK
jgi:hypothetical protein